MHKDVPAVIAVPVCGRVFVVSHIRTDGKKLPIARDAPAQRSFVYSCHALTVAAWAAGLEKKFHEEAAPRGNMCYRSIPSSLFAEALYALMAG